MLVVESQVGTDMTELAQLNYTTNKLKAKVNQTPATVYFKVKGQK